MKIFIDDSGSFGWEKPGKSLFCALTAADRCLPDVFSNFSTWKKNVARAGERKEVKGAELAAQQLALFVQTVILQSSDMYLTLAAVDTALTLRAIVDLVRTQSAEVLAEAATGAQSHGKPLIAQFYSEMSGWLNNRSAQNFCWILTLAKVVNEGIQHTIVSFMDPEDDPEFEELDIVIDASFIRRDRHVNFWQEWLRNELFNGQFDVPGTWSQRNHPWRRKYDRGGGVLELSDLFKNHMRFADSRSSEGLQIADICAHICYRYYRGDEKPFLPYSLLRPRIVGKYGRALTQLQLDQRSLRNGPAATRVHFIMTPEELYDTVRIKANSETQEEG
jgi:Protein of unknown function (DUF3800)